MKSIKQGLLLGSRKFNAMEKRHILYSNTLESTLSCMTKRQARLGAFLGFTLNSSSTGMAKLFNLLGLRLMLVKLNQLLLNYVSNDLKRQYERAWLDHSEPGS